MYLLIGPRSASFTLTTRSIGQSSKVCLSGFDEGATKKGRLGSCVMGGHYPVRFVEQQPGSSVSEVTPRGSLSGHPSLIESFSFKIAAWGGEITRLPAGCSLFLISIKTDIEVMMDFCERLFPYFSTSQKFCKAPSIECQLRRIITQHYTQHLCLMRPRAHHCR